MDEVPITVAGVPLTADYEAELAAEAERGYDPDALRPRPIRRWFADRYPRATAELATAGDAVITESA